MAEGQSLSGGVEDERPLVAAALNGDALAFEGIVRLHADAVYRIVAGHLGPSEAEDAAQEVFVRIHQGLRGFQGDSRLATWIYRVATNVALTRAQRRRGRPRLLPLEGSAEPVETAPGPADTLEAAERVEAVRRAVERLPADQRAVVVLRGFEGLPFDEVARILKIQRPTAESRMARAKERLKTLLTSLLPRGPME
jgi:RNA polymerase sigma-70 factor (ECF subfamily)